jgi:hypothetical protein
VPPDYVWRTEDPRAQGQVRRFERWLMELRLALGEHLGGEGFELLRQRIEMRLDVFGAQAIEQIVRDPEQLRSSVAELRQDLGKEADPAVARRLDEEVLARIPACSFAHFLSEQAHAA